MQLIINVFISIIFNGREDLEIWQLRTGLNTEGSIIFNVYFQCKSNLSDTVFNTTGQFQQFLNRRIFLHLSLRIGTISIFFLWSKKENNVLKGFYLFYESLKWWLLHKLTRKDLWPPGFFLLPTQECIFHRKLIRNNKEI